jgi:hypothetical protein
MKRQVNQFGKVVIDLNSIELSKKGKQGVAHELSTR